VRLARAVLAVAVLVAVLTTMLLLARWQWHRGQQRHSLLNYSYAVEWVTFAGLTLVGAGVLVRDRRRPAPRVDAPAVDGIQVGPPLGPGEDVDVTYVRLLRRLGLSAGG
jgi:cytochrome oxidase assembly protein ShyY1